MNQSLERSFTTVDKSEWGPGPWQGEPDKLQWIDEATGLDCLIVRGPVGALCGYVGITHEHPWFGIPYSGCLLDDCNEDYHWMHSPDSYIECHGGLTYSDYCDEGAPEESGICHVPFDDRSDHVYWYGFDCAHSGDYCPRFDRDTWSREIYRDVSYVQQQCANVAQQLAAIGEGS